jgi:hypothetical protein
MNKMKKVKFYQQMDQNYIRNFLRELAGKYNLVPYHNLTHAFDVTTVIII